MRNDKKVKDKRIMLESVGLYTATVEYFRDTPERDGDVPQEKVFQTIPAAQKWLSKFPRDVWDGFDSSDFNYTEPDERGRYDRKRTARGSGTAGEETCRDNGERCPGRILVGSMRNLR